MKLCFKEQNKTKIRNTKKHKKTRHSSQEVQYPNKRRLLMEKVCVEDIINKLVQENFPDLSSQVQRAY